MNKGINNRTSLHSEWYIILNWMTVHDNIQV